MCVVCVSKERKEKHSKRKERNSATHSKTFTSHSPHTNKLTLKPNKEVY